MDNRNRKRAGEAITAAQDALQRARVALDGPTRPDRAHALQELHEADELVRQATDHAVAHCRYLSDPWTAIGPALGISKQAAGKRWADNPGDREAEREGRAS